MEGEVKEIIVATTRLETMLGDCAVVVHPDDVRYKKLLGKRVLHPYHKNRDMRIHADGILAKMELGTGAVKITPAHDEKDFACAERLGMKADEYVSIFDEDGNIDKTAAGSAIELIGEARYDARLWLVEDLKKKGLFRGEKPNEGQLLPICSRSGDVIEPRLVPQWWVNCEEMATMSLNAVKTGELKLVPDTHNATWYAWLSNPQPWCISRQLWWGHRIPAWRVEGLVKLPTFD